MLLLVGIGCFVFWFVGLLLIYRVLPNQKNAIYHSDTAIMNGFSIFSFALFISISLLLDESGPYVRDALLLVLLAAAVLVGFIYVARSRRILVADDGLHIRSLFWKTRIVSWKFVTQAVLDKNRGRLRLEVASGDPFQVSVIHDRFGVLWEALVARKKKVPEREELEQAILQALSKEGLEPVSYTHLTLPTTPYV